MVQICLECHGLKQIHKTLVSRRRFEYPVKSSLGCQFWGLRSLLSCTGLRLFIKESLMFLFSYFLNHYPSRSGINEVDAWSIQLFTYCLRSILNPLSHEGDFCDQVHHESVRYIHSCLQVAIPIKISTNNPRLKSVVLASSAKRSLSCQFCILYFVFLSQ